MGISFPNLLNLQIANIYLEFITGRQLYMIQEQKVEYILLQQGTIIRRKKQGIWPKTNRIIPGYFSGDFYM